MNINLKSLRLSELKQLRIEIGRLIVDEEARLRREAQPEKQEEIPVYGGVHCISEGLEIWYDVFSGNNSRVYFRIRERVAPKGMTEPSQTAETWTVPVDWAVLLTGIGDLKLANIENMTEANVLYLGIRSAWQLIRNLDCCLEIMEWLQGNGIEVKAYIDELYQQMAARPVVSLPDCQLNALIEAVTHGCSDVDGYELVAHLFVQENGHMAPIHPGVIKGLKHVQELRQAREERRAEKTRKQPVTA